MKDFLLKPVVPPVWLRYTIYFLVGALGCATTHLLAYEFVIFPLLLKGFGYGPTVFAGFFVSGFIGGSVGMLINNRLAKRMTAHIPSYVWFDASETGGYVQLSAIGRRMAESKMAIDPPEEGRL